MEARASGTARDARASTDVATTIALRSAVVAASLGVADLGVGALRGSALFLRPVEWVRFGALAIAGAFAVGVAFFTLARGLERLARAWAGARAELVLTLVAGLSASVVASALLWDLTEGRRVREHALRLPAVALVALVGGVLVALLVARVRRANGATGGASRRARVGLGLAGALAALGAAVADAYVLPRLYPSFHLGLALVAVLASLASGAAIPPLTAVPRAPHLAARALLLLAIPLAAFAAAVAASAPNTSFAIRTAAPIAGKVIALVEPAAPAAPAEEAPMATSHVDDQGGPGLSLGDADVLLVTVDALRADRLEAYGGRGLTPAMDALAREGMVFTRAYTPTPHTSYAVSSLLTGKYLRPVLELARAPTDHPTLPDLLRRYGFRTAAFYPPAIFYVDAERFRVLEERAYGFEYRKEMFAPAADRVAQVEEYLATVPEGMPVFVWVHFFEPHEPYEPPPDLARDDTAEGRYDGEVAAVDRALGALVRSFRARRPGATVVLTADHGEELGDHGGQFHGSTVYDEQVRVPLVWSSPGVVAPGRSDAPVELVDLATTLLSALGIPREARMRGDDLGPLLAGGASAPAHAFAAVEDERMITDGRLKAICELRAPICRLYDLVADPGERTNVAERRPADEARLRGALAELTSSIPRIEALAMEGATGWPEALARGALGDVTALPAIEPLLGDARAEVRAEAARLVAALGHAAGLPMLARLSTGDPDPIVRAEAALGRLALGDDEAGATVRALLDPAVEPDLARRRRASRALARIGDATGAPILAAWAADAGAGEAERLDAIAALADLRDRASVPALLGLLEDVRLRPALARAFSSIGDARAATALATILADERHLDARAAEAEALVALGDRRARALVLRFLGTEQPLPGGIALLDRLAALAPYGRVLDADAADEGFDCDERGCVPRPGARLALPRPRGRKAHRLVVSVEGTPGVRLRLGEVELTLAGGPQEVSMPWAPGREPTVAIEASAGVRVRGVVVVPVGEEVPAPAPEPWEADADSESDSDSDADSDSDSDSDADSDS